MIKDKNIAVCIILCIVTCGIYGIYWFICLTNDANTASNTFGTSGGVAFLIDAAKTKRGVPSSNSGVLYLILCLFVPIVAWALMQNELNNMAN